MRIAVVGAGSIGLLLAGKLARHPSLKVSIVTRTAEQARLIASGGILVTEDGKTTISSNVQAISFGQLQASEVRPLSRDGTESKGLKLEGLVSEEESGEAKAEGCDWILLTVKQTHIDRDLLQALKSMMGEGAKLLCLQNGVGHVERLREHGIDKGRIFLAVTTEAAKRTAGNHVVHTGRGTTAVGSAAGREKNGEAAELVARLTEAGFAGFVADDIETQVWKKLLINSVINPLTAILRIRNGELLDSEDRRMLMKLLYEEGMAVLAKAVPTLPPALWDDLIGVCVRTRDNTSSMLQDLAAGRETEIDWINGSLIRLASEHGVGAPTHRTVYHLVKAMEVRREL